MFLSWQWTPIRDGHSSSLSRPSGWTCGLHHQLFVSGCLFGNCQCFIRSRDLEMNPWPLECDQVTLRFDLGKVRSIYHCCGSANGNNTPHRERNLHRIWAEVRSSNVALLTHRANWWQLKLSHARRLGIWSLENLQKKDTPPGLLGFVWQNFFSSNQWRLWILDVHRSSWGRNKNFKVIISLVRRTASK